MEFRRVLFRSGTSSGCVAHQETMRSNFTASSAMELISIRSVSMFSGDRIESSRDWSRDGLLRDIRRALNKPDWRAGGEGTIPGGRDVGKNMIDTFYGNQ